MNISVNIVPFVYSNETITCDRCVGGECIKYTVYQQYHYRDVMILDPIFFYT